jgi:hypothetical protein
LSAGRLKHREPDWVDTLRLAEDLSSRHTELLGNAAVNLWHVASAILLEADTFWSFDEEQQELARATRKFRRRTARACARNEKISDGSRVETIPAAHG